MSKKDAPEVPYEGFKEFPKWVEKDGHKTIVNNAVEEAAFLETEFPDPEDVKAPDKPDNNSSWSKKSK